jgi:hypothetical protein
MSNVNIDINININKIEIVVARYNENLSWMNESPFNEFKYTVYNKGINTDFEQKYINKIISLPNVGRCDHTFLYHIIVNYKNLSDITIFFPGSINLSNKKGKAIEIINRIKNNNYTNALFIGEFTPNLKNRFNNFKLDNWLSSDTQNSMLYNDVKLYPSTIRPYGKWFRYHFGNLIIKYFTINSIFSIDKKDILQHPIQRYIYLIKQLRIHANPEVGHYVERSWSAIFYPLKYTKVLLTRV